MADEIIYLVFYVSNLRVKLRCEIIWIYVMEYIFEYHVSFVVCGVPNKENDCYRCVDQKVNGCYGGAPI